MKAFDTQRLDEECERIAAEIFQEHPEALAFSASPVADGDLNHRWTLFPKRTGPERVRDIITGQDRRWQPEVLEWVFSRCRRPKMVAA